MCYVQIYIVHENMMSRVRTYVTFNMCYVRTYATHEYGFCRNLCSIRKYNMSEPMIHTKYDVSCPNLCYIKVCYVRIYVAHENMMSRVRTYIINENV